MVETKHPLYWEMKRLSNTLASDRKFTTEMYESAKETLASSLGEENTFKRGMAVGMEIAYESQLNHLRQLEGIVNELFIKIANDGQV